MRICHVSIYPPAGQMHAHTGGVASYTKHLVQSQHHLQPHDEIHVICDQIDGQADTYTEDGVQIHRIFNRDWRFVGQIWRQIQILKPDIIHFQQELGLYGPIITAWLLQWLLFLLRSQRILITLHGVVAQHLITPEFIRENNASYPVWLTKLAFRLIFTPLCRWSRQIIVHETSLKHILVQDYQARTEQIVVIPHGIEPKSVLSKAEACAQLQLQSAHHIVLFMGYLTGYKGLELLIEGFAQYAQQDSQAFLIVAAGEHPRLKSDPTYLAKYQALRTLAQTSLPSSQYRWVGFVKEEDIPLYYSAADVSIYPYTVAMSSSGPMAIAIGYGKPFLVSEVFVGTSVASSGPDGNVFARHPDSLSQRLAAFFANKALFQKEVSRQAASKAWPEVARAHLTVYHHIS